MKYEDVVEKDCIYSEDVVENLIDDDCLTPAEAGFMKGYIDAT